MNEGAPGSVRSIGRTFVVEPVRVRRPPRRRAFHGQRNVRARPVGRAGEHRHDVQRPGASRLPAVIHGGGSGPMLAGGSGPRREPRARQTAIVVAPSPKDRRRREDRAAHVRDETDHGLDRPPREERGHRAWRSRSTRASHRLRGDHDAEQRQEHDREQQVDPRAGRRALRPPRGATGPGTLQRERDAPRRDLRPRSGRRPPAWSKPRGEPRARTVDRAAGSTGQPRATIRTRQRRRATGG